MTPTNRALSNEIPFSHRVGETGQEKSFFNARLQQHKIIGAGLSSAATVAIFDTTILKYKCGLESCS